MLSFNAVVLNIGHPSSTSSDAVDDVQVAVSPADAAGVSCNAANNNVGVGVLPDNGRGAAAASPLPGGPASPSPGRPAAPSSSGTTPPSGGTG